MLGLRQCHRLELLLLVAGLPRSTYYYQLKSQTASDRHAALKKRIQCIYKRHRGRYGYRRITLELRQGGARVNHKTVQTLMQQQALKARVRIKKYRAYRGEGNAAIPNLLQRQFHAERPNQKWVTDVTEFNIRGEKLFLSPVLDLYNGEIVAYQTARRPCFKLVSGMLHKALTKLPCEDKPLLHSDQGWQYQMSAYQRVLRDRGLTQSMSRKGNCLDNATMESFFGTLKSELFHLTRFTSIEQLQQALKGYIYYYNHKRIRIKLKGLSPVQYRTQPLMV